MTSLPRDVLSCIFAFFPLHPRLNALSFVCKQWRAAALASVQEISMPLQPDRAVALFSSLRRLEIREFTPALLLALPPSICDLSCLYGAQPRLITSLSSLTLWCTNMPLPETLLFPSARGLTSLRLDLGKVDIDFLSGVFFPSLSSLALRYQLNFIGSTLSASVVEFVGRHASQLTSLGIGDHEDLLFAIAKHSFPRLARLQVTFPLFSPTTDGLCDLLCQCPTSVQLSLSSLDCKLFENAPAIIAHRLVHCEFTMNPFAVIPWRSFTHLSSLKIALQASNTDGLRSLPATLTDLCCSFDSNALSQIVSLTRLHTLQFNIHCSTPPNPMPISIRCPHITALHITARLVGVQTEISQVFAHMRALQLLSCFPSLQRLYFKLPISLPPSILHELEGIAARIPSLEEVRIAQSPSNIPLSTPWCRFVFGIQMKDQW